MVIATQKLWARNLTSNSFTKATTIMQYGYFIEKITFENIYLITQIWALMIKSQCLVHMSQEEILFFLTLK
jgi:hypothetical protein